MAKIRISFLRSENFIFFAISALLALYSYRVVTGDLVLNVLYFYKNQFAGMVVFDHNDTSILTLVASGLLGHLLVAAITKIAFSQYLIPLLVAILTFSITKSLFAQMRNFFSSAISVLLLLVILFTPLSGKIRDNFLSQSLTREDTFGLLFATFPYPLITLLGLTLTLGFFFKNRNSLFYPTKSALIICTATFLIHPFLFFFFLCCLVPHIIFLRSRRMGLFSSRLLRLALLSLPAVLTLYLGISVLFASRDVLGTLTFDIYFKFDFFEFCFYLLAPTSILMVSLILINVSKYELSIRFYPILIFFFLELSLTLLSIVTSRDYTVFLRFNGLSQVAHILYYIPAIYVFVSYEKRQRIKLLNVEKLGAVTNLAIKKLIPPVSWLLSITVTVSTLANNWPLLARHQKCPQVEQLREIWRSDSEGIDPSARSFDRLIESRELLFNSEQFMTFLEKPVWSLRSNGLERSVCELDGLGYLMLNGFFFNSKAIDEAKKVALTVEERVKSE